MVLATNSRLFKGLILLTLTLSTSLTVLLMRVSRLSEEDPSKAYLPSTVVFITECVKFCLCLASLFYFQGFWEGCKCFMEDIIQNPGETSRLSIPAGLYALQNNLLYLALTYLDSATYQVTYQLKILTTAIFSVVMLDRRLKIKQWFALILLSCGVMLVQFQATRSVTSMESSHKHKSHHSKHEGHLTDSDSFHMVGIVSVLGACVTSGISGVYFEMLVKKSVQKSVIIRNIQLGLISLPMTFLAVTFEDFSKKSFFQGYNRLTIGIITMQSLGGLLVAIVVKYADNILKGFSTSISIIVCTICSYWFIEVRSEAPGFLFYAGTLLVVIASCLYSLASSTASGDKSNIKPVKTLTKKVLTNT